jgi:hypothetical protein
MFIQMYESYPEYQDDITLAIYKRYVQTIVKQSLFHVMEPDPIKKTNEDIKKDLYRLKEKITPQ